MAWGGEDRVSVSVDEKGVRIPDSLDPMSPPFWFGARAI